MRSLVGLLICVLSLVTYIAGGALSHSESVPQLKIILCYEAYCSDCIGYDRFQLGKAWDRFKNSMELTLIPYGNAEQKYVDGHWVFTCQHGPKECLANRLHACAIDQACPSGRGTAGCPVDDVSRVLGYTRCVMNHPDQLQATYKCAKAANLDPDSIIECAKNQRGEFLLNMYGNMTEAIRPRTEYVPWVLLNGNHDKPAEDDLVKEICTLEPCLCSPALCSSSGSIVLV